MTRPRTCGWTALTIAVPALILGAAVAATLSALAYIRRMELR